MFSIVIHRSGFDCFIFTIGYVVFNYEACAVSECSLLNSGPDSLWARSGRNRLQAKGSNGGDGQ